MLIDVGAHFGLYSALGASLVGADGLVMSLEPHPGLCDLARQNALLNGDAPVVALPLGAGSFVTRTHLAVGGAHVPPADCPPTAPGGQSPLYRLMPSWT